MTPDRIRSSEPASAALLTPNQIVARNIAEMRREMLWTQRKLCEELEPFLGVRWSIAVLSAAERSVERGRVREFSADELVALARVFGVGVGRLFMLPEPQTTPPTRMAVPDLPAGLDDEQVTELAAGVAKQWVGESVERALTAMEAHFQDAMREALRKVLGQIEGESQ